jgi:hypothetical protein
VQETCNRAVRQRARAAVELPVGARQQSHMGVLTTICMRQLTLVKRARAWRCSRAQGHIVAMGHLHMPMSTCKCPKCSNIYLAPLLGSRLSPQGAPRLAAGCATGYLDTTGTLNRKPHAQCTATDEHLSLEHLPLFKWHPSSTAGASMAHSAQRVLHQALACTRQLMCSSLGRGLSRAA